MNRTAVLKRVVGALQTAAIPHMVTGSVASGFHGEPRATNDVDCVIDPTPAQLDTFLGALGEEFYVSVEAARQALARRGTFNLVHPPTGLKIDLIIRRETAFAAEEFERRVPGNVWGVEASIATPEDVILSKLAWAQQSDSERQRRDALGVARVSAPRLDLRYLRQWAERLGIAPLLAAVLREAGAAE